MRISRWILISIVAAVFLAGCCAVRAPMDGPPTAGADTTPRPTLAPVSTGKTVAADGYLVSPYPSVEMSFGGDASGQVLSIAVKAGDEVRAGDLLAELDDTELQRAVDEAQLALDRASADLEEATEQWERDLADAQQTLADAERALTVARLEYSDTDLEQARDTLKWAQKSESDRKAEYEEAMTLWPPRPVDAQRDAWHRAIDDREIAEMQLADAENSHQAEALKLRGYEEDVAKAQRDLAAIGDGVDVSHEREVEDARLDLVKAQENLGHARIVAPWPAIVLSVDVAPGSEVDATMSIVTLLKVKDGLRFLTQDLSEQHIANVYPGQRAVVTLRTYAQSPLEGTVEAVVPQVEDTESEDSRFTVYVQLEPVDDADLRLLPGLSGRVEIHTVD